MAINGKYPVLLVGMADALTQQESSRLNLLEALKNPTKEQLLELDSLKLKSDIPGLTESYTPGFLSGATEKAKSLTRMPIILDGEIIKAKPDGYQSTMSKTLTLLGDNSIGVKSLENRVTISIKTKSSKTDVSVFPDIICSVADIIFSKKDSVPRISYFGDNVIIPDGYLVGLSRNSSADSEIEIISITIQKSLNTEEKKEAKEQKPEQKVYEVSDLWQ